MEAYYNKLGFGYLNKDLKDHLDEKADIDSPTLTGTPKAPTPADDADPSQIATVEYVSEHGVDNLMVATDEEVTEKMKEIFGIVVDDSESDEGDSGNEPSDDNDDEGN